MSLLRNVLKKKNKISTIQRKGDKILSVFTKTQKQLEELNKNALAEIEFRNSQLALINEQIALLQNMSTKHQNLNNKINSFLND